MYKANTTKVSSRGGKRKIFHNKKPFFAILCLDSVSWLEYPKETIPAQTDYNTVPVYILAEFSVVLSCHNTQ